MIAAPDIVTWRLSPESCAALTRLIGAPIGLRGVGHELCLRPPVRACLTEVEIFNFDPHFLRQATLTTSWHTSKGGIDWHEIIAVPSDGPATKPLSVFAPTNRALSQVEMVTVHLTHDFPQDAHEIHEELSLDFAINLVFADGEAMHLTTDLDSILGAFVVSNGRFDPASLDWEGLRHETRALPA